MKIILFSGAHGVGKGFFLNKVKENIQQYDVLSASSLIERYQPSTDAGYKKVKDINSNQDVLIKAIEEAMKKGSKDIILDGHLCIFNAKGEVERIPEYFFHKTHIVGIVLLHDDPRVICDRICNRDINHISVKDLEYMQDEECKYAMELEEKHHIKHVIISHEFTGALFEKILREIGGDSIE